MIWTKHHYSRVAVFSTAWRQAAACVQMVPVSAILIAVKRRVVPVLLKSRSRETAARSWRQFQARLLTSEL
jgi:hypothetical protein